MKLHTKMKTALLLFFSLLIAGGAFAQDTIPNQSFESWKSMGTYSDPTGWTSLNALSIIGFPISCTKETPGSKGNSYVKLTNVKAMTGDIIPGSLVTGTIDITTGSGAANYYFKGRPKAFTGVVMHKLGKSDTAFMAVALTKWNSTKKSSDTIATCEVFLRGDQSTWKSFSSNFTYLSTANPDSCSIEISSSISFMPVEGNYLCVDNLGFSNVSGISSPVQNNVKMDVYPNPVSNGVLNINMDNAGQGQYNINMIDLNGKVISESTTNAVAGKLQYSMNTASLAKGVYMLKVYGNDAVSLQKVSIQ